MSKTGKNLIVSLGIVTVVFAGYYFFSQEASTVLRSSQSDQQLEQLLRTSQTFVQHRQILDEITLDTAILRSPEFASLRSFSVEPAEFQVGRSNPFITTQPERPVSATPLNTATQ